MMLLSVNKNDVLHLSNLYAFSFIYCIDWEGSIVQSWIEMY